jgi:hypothetical protein
VCASDGASRFVFVANSSRPVRTPWPLAIACVLIVGAMSVAMPVASFATPNPPHGHWQNTPSGPILVCDLSYYVAEEGCLQVLAFRHAARRGDRLPSSVLGFTSLPRLSRHVETARDPSGHVWNLYLAIEDHAHDATRDPCLEVVRDHSYWGGLCVPGSDLVAPGAGSRWIMGERVLIGMAGSNISQVRVLDAHRHAQPVRLSTDRSFIYFCNSDCGCAISAVVTVSRTGVSAADNLLAGGEESWCGATQLRALLRDVQADGHVDGIYSCAVVQEAIARTPNRTAAGDTLKALQAYELNIC